MSRHPIRSPWTLAVVLVLLLGLAGSVACTKEPAPGQSTVSREDQVDKPDGR